MTTKIEWTDETWNPVTGCTKVSQGCKNCYAERIWPKVEAAQRMREHWDWQKAPKRAFTEVRMHPNRLDAPLHWKRPRRIFVNSMSDLFHEDVTPLFIGSVLGIAAACAQHTFQVLTKRPQRMLEVLASEAFLMAFEESADMYTDTTHFTWPVDNVWLGVSVEDQATADERIPLLLQTPAAVRFISAEPLLEPIDCTKWFFDASEFAYGTAPAGLDWVIAGGESGPNARPSNPGWFRSLRDQCANAGVPFFFKQWGELMPVCELKDAPKENVPPKLMFYPSAEYCFEKVGKKAAGRQLDGRTHEEYPA
ncbi:MAG TPA: phage Gp37/Gp68 family protein [Burkholderiales bacterium]|nr:phage Gp37/Gp68 family protein [Burkholderiales bacterium]